MASPPGEPRLGRLGDLYAEALAAARDGDFGRVNALIDSAGALLHGDQDLGAGGAAADQERAVRAHRALLEALADERDQTLAALMRLRKGRGALAAYGGRLDPTGSRIERDG